MADHGVNERIKKALKPGLRKRHRTRVKKIRSIIRTGERDLNATKKR